MSSTSCGRKQRRPQTSHTHLIVTAASDELRDVTSLAAAEAAQVNAIRLGTSLGIFEMSKSPAAAETTSDGSQPEELRPS